MSRRPRHPDASQQNLFAAPAPATGLALGRKLRDRGLDSVEAHGASFCEIMLPHLIAQAQRVGYAWADDARRIADSLGLRPHHPNAWGSLFRGRGWVKTGRRQQSAYATNHAHEHPHWRWDPVAAQEPRRRQRAG